MFRRRRLAASEKERLEAEYMKGSNWSRRKIREVATMLNFSYVKVYKWHYDRKHRPIDAQLIAE